MDRHTKGVCWLDRPQTIDPVQSSRRLLLFSAAFPPRTEIGAARWEGFAGFLHSAGWGMDVLIEDPSDLASPNFDRFRNLPGSVRVATYRKQSPRWHQRLLRTRDTIRSLFAKPPTDTPPLSPFTRMEYGNSGTLKSILRSTMSSLVMRQQSNAALHDVMEIARGIHDAPYDVVVSSGPPHYVHWAAHQFARQRKLPHVVDLRDPWTNATHQLRRSEMVFDQELQAKESEVLTTAALVVTTSNAAARVLCQRFPERSSHIFAIPNGSDIEPIFETHANDTVFRIAHCGSLYLDRDPRPFLRACAGACQALGLGAHNVQVVFMGPSVLVEGRTLEQWGESYGLQGILDVRPLGSRQEARELLATSAMAVAFQGATPTQIPAKVFEYVAFPLWLLALVGKGTATADLLDGTDAIVLDLHETTAIQQALISTYVDFRAGQRPLAVGADGRFSRARQACALLQHLDRCVLLSP